MLSTGFQVSGDAAYTVAGMGPAAALRLQVLKDTFTAPAGQVLVRVIQTSLRQHVVSMSLGGLMLARKLDFASMTPYTKVAAGNATVRVTGSGEDATARLALPADTALTVPAPCHRCGVRWPASRARARVMRASRSVRKASSAARLASTVARRSSCRVRHSPVSCRRSSSLVRSF